MDYNIKSIREDFKKKGIFYTPKELANLMKSYVDIDVDEVYDPTCGDGGILAVFDDCIKKYGQEINKKQLDVAKNNLVNFIGFCGDTLANPAFVGKKFKCIMANPPFSIAWNPPKLGDFFNDERWRDIPAMPPKSKADYAFLIHILHYLADDGIAVTLNFPGILYRGKSEYELRKYIINKNFIEKIVKIPSKTFVDTNIETTLIVFKKNKKVTDIEFIDKEINKSRVVSLVEIQKENYELSVNKYIYEDKIKEIIDPAKLQNDARNHMIKKIIKDLSFDAMVCKIEGWNHIEYCERLISEIITYKNKLQN